MSKQRWVTYPRCFILTMAVIFLGLVALIISIDGVNRAEWPHSAYFLLGSLGALGTLGLMGGLFASNDRIRKWFDSTPIHGEALVVAIIATPVYFLLSLFEPH